jgi:hypothetical protein
MLHNRPVVFRLAKFLNGDPTIGTTDDRTDRNHYHIQQSMCLGAIHPRIIKRGKGMLEGHKWITYHELPPALE